MATQRIMDHIDTLRAKPEHVRHQIAMAVAFGVTGVVAAGWIAAMATSGTLALKSEPIVTDLASVEKPSTPISSLLGAAGAAFGATSTDASLNIVDSKTSSTLDTKAVSPSTSGKTVIPF